MGSFLEILKQSKSQNVTLPEVAKRGAFLMKYEVIINIFKQKITSFVQEYLQY